MNQHPLFVWRVPFSAKFWVYPGRFGKVLRSKQTKGRHFILSCKIGWVGKKSAVSPWSFDVKAIRIDREMREDTSTWIQKSWRWNTSKIFCESKKATPQFEDFSGQNFLVVSTYLKNMSQKTDHSSKDNSKRSLKPPPPRLRYLLIADRNLHVAPMLWSAF